MPEGTPGERIGRRVRAVRERELYTRPELAKRSGVAIPTIEALEGGLVARPRRGTVEKLAKALDVDAHTLMDGPDATLDAPRQRSEAPLVIVGRVEEDPSGDERLRMVVLWNVPPEEREPYRASLRMNGMDDFREEELTPQTAEQAAELLAAAV